MNWKIAISLLLAIGIAHATAPTITNCTTAPTGPLYIDSNFSWNCTITGSDSNRYYLENTTDGNLSHQNKTYLRDTFNNADVNTPINWRTENYAESGGLLTSPNGTDDTAWTDKNITFNDTNTIWDWNFSVTGAATAAGYMCFASKATTLAGSSAAYGIWAKVGDNIKLVHNCSAGTAFITSDIVTASATTYHIKVERDTYGNWTLQINNVNKGTASNTTRTDANYFFISTGGTTSTMTIGDLNVYQDLNYLYTPTRKLHNTDFLDYFRFKTIACLGSECTETAWTDYNSNNATPTVDKNIHINARNGTTILTNWALGIDGDPAKPLTTDLNTTNLNNYLLSTFLNYTTHSANYDVTAQDLDEELDSNTSTITFNETTRDINIQLTTPLIDLNFWRPDYSTTNLQVSAQYNEKDIVGKDGNTFNALTAAICASGSGCQLRLNTTDYAQTRIFLRFPVQTINDNNRQQEYQFDNTNTSIDENIYVFDQADGAISINVVDSTGAPIDDVKLRIFYTRDGRKHLITQKFTESGYAEFWGENFAEYTLEASKNGYITEIAGPRLGLIGIALGEWNITLRTEFNLLGEIRTYKTPNRIVHTLGTIGRAEHWSINKLDICYQRYINDVNSGNRTCYNDQTSTSQEITISQADTNYAIRMWIENYTFDFNWIKPSNLNDLNIQGLTTATATDANNKEIAIVLAFAVIFIGVLGSFAYEQGIGAIAITTIIFAGITSQFWIPAFFGLFYFISPFIKRILEGE